MAKPSPSAFRLLYQILFLFAIGTALVVGIVAAVPFGRNARLPGFAGQEPVALRRVAAQSGEATEAPTARAPRSGYGSNAGGGWWSAGQGGILPVLQSFNDSTGKIGVLNAAGRINTKGHPFFEPLGTNGRACVTCHQPSDGMSISVASLRERWKVTHGKDPVFAAVDGSNCPNQPQEQESSHSLLLNRGLFRIYLPWPPKAEDGTTLKPEFTIEVVRDPTGCNLDPAYGLVGAKPMVSVYRRPRVVANMKYVTFGGFVFNPKNLAMAMPLDPDTGKRVGLNFLSDARDITLKDQAIDAAINHEQAGAPLSDEQLRKIMGFEMQVFSAQSFDRNGGSLTEKGGPQALGPANLAGHTPGVLGDNFGTPVFIGFDMWKKRAADETVTQSEFRQSVARGWNVFFTRSFWIRDSQYINSIGLGNPIKRTCATCHNTQMTGTDLVSGWVDLGTNNLPWADDAPELPLFKITCDATAPPHQYLGRVIYTHDPGRALISGKCMDVGSVVMQQFRGLSARAPYFTGGSAATLRALVDFYDRRYNIGFSEGEKQDLINFLSCL
jgi:hypothetical protein